MTASILLDTCAVLWIAQGAPLAREAEDALNAAWGSGESARVSPISAWEIGLLVARGRLSMTMAPDKWWATFMGGEGLELVAMPPEVLMASAFLPGQPPNDPADRIVAATCRASGLRLMTRDRRLLAYGEAGHLQTIAC